MKTSVLLGTFICAFVIVQVHTWRMTYPKTSKQSFSRRPERSVFGKSSINRQLQTFLTPTRGLQRPHIRQRNIRDLMTRFVANNHGPPPSFNRQRAVARPTTGIRTRDVNFRPAYHRDYALPANPVRHSIQENPRGQTMVIREPTLRNINISPALRPQPTFQRATMGASSLQTAQVLKELRGVQAPQSMYTPKRQNTALLDSATLKDILSSSTDTRLRSQKAPKRVEVIHHVPMPMSPNKLKTGGSAVVYISKPKPDIQASQGMFMRNLPPASSLAAGQSKLTQNPSFIMRGHDSVYSTGSNLNDQVTAMKNALQNTHFAPSNTKTFQKQVQAPYLVPTTGMKEKFVTNGFKNHHNAALTSVLKNAPQPHVLRVASPNSNIKQGKPDSLAAPIRATQNKIPRINRLKQELNAEIEQLLKLVPQSKVTMTKKPKLMIQQQIPHPFLIPSPEFTGNLNTNKYIETSFSPDVSRNIPRNQQLPGSNSKYEIQQPHMVPLNTKDGFLNGHSLKDMKISKIPDILPLNHRRPVVSQSTVDSEELAEILESIGYPGKSKVIHNMAGREPVKIIIPDESENTKHVFNSSSDESLPSHSNGYAHDQKTAILSPYHGENIQATKTDSSSPYGEGIHPSKTENLSHTNEDIHPPKTEVLSPYNNGDSHLTETENISPYYNEDVHSLTTENVPPHYNEGFHPLTTENVPPHYNEDIHPVTTEHVFPYFNENIHPLSGENLPFSGTEDSSPIKIEDQTSSNTEEKTHVESSKEGLNESDLTLPNNDSHTNKTYWNFRTENVEAQTSPSPITEVESLKLDTNEKELPFSHSANNYQGEESIASISVKEEFPMEEEIKERFRHKQENLKLNQGTLHDVYKKLHDENTQIIPPPHYVRYIPQRLRPVSAETLPSPVVENKIRSPDATTKTYEHNEHAENSNSGASVAKVTYVAKYPQNNAKHSFSALSTTESTTHRKPTVFPNYFTTSKSSNVSPLHRSPPRYVITKTPRRQPYLSNRNKPRNENSLIPKYIVPERQQFENPRLNTSEYVSSEVIRKYPTYSKEQNIGFSQFTTESTSPPSSSTSDRFDYLTFVRENRLKYADKTDFTTPTNVPEETTHSSFELGTAESQVENTQEIENNANEFNSPETTETSTTISKQFFRGPQHSIVYDDFTTHSFPEPTTDFIPHIYSKTTIIPTTATYVPEINPFIQYNEPGVRQYSVNSQSKVINALHLANKVFGRRNHTSFKPVPTTKMPIPTTKMPIPTTKMPIPTTKISVPTTKMSVPTTKMPLFRHKFTYAPVVKSSTKQPTTQLESTTSRRVVFNFRTGTTQSIPIRTSSVAPKVIFNPVNRSKLMPKSKNDSIDFISDIKEDDKVISSGSAKNVFHHVVFSQPNISSKPQNQSVATETSKDLYGILKPITKPYNSSSTSVTEKEFKKLITTKSFKVQISSTTIKPTSPISVFTSTKDMEQSSSLATEYSSSTETNLPNTSSMKDISVEEITETTMPFTNSIATEVETEAASKTKVFKTDVNLEMNVTMTSTPIEITTESINQEQVIVDSLKSMKIKMQDMASKGLRHLMPLVMELSSDVSISSDCTFSLLRWLRAVRTMEQWAVRMMDASSKIPEGILYGTFSTFGSYDECVAIKTPKVNLQMPYSGQYCSINIQPVLPPSERHFTIQNAFRKYPKLKQVFQEMNIDEDTMAYYYILKHRIGLCMPSTCSMEDLGNVTEKLADELKMKISVERCETSEKPSLTRGQIISMCCVFITFGIVILATIIDLSMRVRSDHEMDIDEIIRKKNGIRQFSYVFSAFGNARKILDTSIPTTHLSSLHGIKFLSITWVMLGHVYYCKDYLTLAGLNKVRDLGSNLAFQVVLNSAYGADTFFFLSGLLVVYSTFLYLENNNGHFTIVGFYIRRYWRLTPAFLMISGVILLGPLAGSGPIWHETLEPFVSGCQNYWWTNLFYFSNFMPTDKTCVPHGWFLSCDMQFYIVAPIIILALYRRPKLGILLIILGILSSMITTGFLTFLYNLPPVSLFSLPDPKDINEYLDTVGYKPYAHYSSYCVGMATGFLLAAKQKISISKCLQTFGWVASSVGCLLVIYGTWNWNSGELPDWPVSVAYATTSRTAWCLGVAWLTIVCYAGHGGPVNSILSWHGFIPLSRLSYLAYLIHPLLMYLYASYVRSPFYFSQYVVVYLYLGHLCVTFGLAFLFSLAFEVPFLNLEKVITKYLDKSKRKRRASFSNHHNNWQHPEHPELKDSVVLMRRRADKFLT